MMQADVPLIIQWLRNHTLSHQWDDNGKDSLLCGVACEGLCKMCVCAHSAAMSIPKPYLVVKETEAQNGVSCKD